MKIMLLAGAALAALAVSAAALADDPHDPAMRSAAARARDRAMIRELNRQELAMVQQRDAGYAEGWRATREAQGAQDGYDAQRRDADAAQADYARSRAQYDRDMAAWRRAVAACRAGDWSACDN